MKIKYLNYNFFIHLNFMIPSRTTRTICCGNTFTICISTDKKVYSFGMNGKGAHGHENEVVFPPKMIPSLKNIESVDCGANHTVCLDCDGNVFTFGRNNFGQLGIGDESVSITHIPQKVTLPPIKQIACGGDFTFCLTREGRLYVFGYDCFGAVGLGSLDTSRKTKQFSPKIINKPKTMVNIEFIESAGSQVMCKTFDNKVFCWGYNYYGQLGISRNKTTVNTPVLLKKWKGLKNIVDIKCGGGHTLVLLSNGDVYSCGDEIVIGRETDEEYYDALNDYFICFSSSLKKIEALSNIVRIECGCYNSYCIDSHYNLFVFGKLGINQMDSVNSPIIHPSLSNIIDVASGGLITFVKTSNNEIYALGDNRFSQLGIKTENKKQTTPIRVFEDNEDIWFSNINKSKAKSARF